MPPLFLPLSLMRLSAHIRSPSATHARRAHRRSHTDEEGLRPTLHQADVLAPGREGHKGRECKEPAHIQDTLQILTLTCVLYPSRPHPPYTHICRRTQAKSYMIKKVKKGSTSRLTAADRCSSPWRRKDWEMIAHIHTTDVQPSLCTSSTRASLHAYTYSPTTHICAPAHTGKVVHDQEGSQHLCD